MGSYLRIAPLLLIIIARSVNFGGEDVEDLGENSLVKTVLTFIAYGLAGAIVAVSPGLIGRYMRPLALYSAYFFFAFLTLAWSSYPLMTVSRLIHIVFTAIVCVVAAEEGAADWRKVAGAVRITLVAICAASLVVAYVMPYRGIVHAAWALEDGIESRWVGVTGHPNILGSAAFLAIWLSAFRLVGSGSVLAKLACVGEIALCGFLLVKSDSRSSEIALLVALIYAACAALKVGAAQRLDRRHASDRIGRQGAILTVVVFACGVIAIVAPQMVGLLARQDTSYDSLSGRPDIWAGGVRAVFEFPFGWGEDQLMTYWDTHMAIEKVSHFHDGYLDVTVRTGICGAAVMFAIIGQTAKFVFSPSRDAATIRWSIMGFFAAFLVYNIVESAIERETPVWTICVFIWLRSFRSVDSATANSGDEAFRAAPASPRALRLRSPQRRG